MPTQRQCSATRHPDARLLQAAHPSTMPHCYKASSMKAIGIRCWPDSHHALPGCPSEGAERRGTSLRAPSHSQRPIASEAPNALTAPLVPAGTSTCRRKRPGSTFCGYAQVFLRPALRPRPAHCTLMSGCTRTHCLPSATDPYMYRPTPAAPRVCERLKRGLRPYPPRYRSSTPRSGPRCAAQVHGAARWSTRRRILR